jgi:hypothetical protein
MRRQNGKEEGATASWEDKLSRYTPQNKVVEVEAEAFFLLVMIVVPRGASSISPIKSGQE